MVVVRFDEFVFAKIFVKKKSSPKKNSTPIAQVFDEWKSQISTGTSFKKFCQISNFREIDDQTREELAKDYFNEFVLCSSFASILARADCCDFPYAYDELESEILRNFGVHVPRDAYHSIPNIFVTARPPPEPWIHTAAAVVQLVVPTTAGDFFSDWRVTSVSQLPTFLEFLSEFHGMHAPSTEDAPRPLHITFSSVADAARSLDLPPPIIVAYLDVPKSAPLVSAGLFDSSQRVVFLPVCPDVGLDKQLAGLDPKYFICKVSDYLACPIVNSQFIIDLNSKMSTLAGLGTKILTPLASQKIIIDRQRFFPLLVEVCIQTGLYPRVRVANFSNCCVPVANIPPHKFPIICKGRLGGGPDVAHRVAIAFDADGVANFGESMKSPPAILGLDNASVDDDPDELLEDISSGLVLQEIVAHSPPVVHKIFVLGQKIFVGKQLSLPDPTQIFTNKEIGEFYRSLCHRGTDIESFHRRVETNKFMAFNTMQLKGGLDSGCIPLDSGCVPLESQNVLEPSVVRSLVVATSGRLGTSLLGFDIVVEDGSGALVVVDLNFMPSYKGVDNVGDAFREWLAGAEV